MDRQGYAPLTQVALYEKRKKEREKRVEKQQFRASVVFGAIMGIALLPLLRMFFWALYAEGLL